MARPASEHPEWESRRQAAQELRFYEIGGREYDRIPFPVPEDSPDEDDSCHDCGVWPGELHLPGCDDEECPLCGGQAFACDCDYPPAAWRLS